MGNSKFNYHLSVSTLLVERNTRLDVIKELSKYKSFRLDTTFIYIFTLITHTLSTSIFLRFSLKYLDIKLLSKSKIAT